MKEVFLGKYIRQKRIEQGLTQEQLCDGICEPMTLSRLENGRQTPSRNVVNALLQRLGIAHDRYFALLSKKEMEIVLLQREIVSCCIHKTVSTGLEKLKVLEKLADDDDRLIQQFVLRTKVLLGKAEGDPYTFEERLSMLMEAICLTVPGFDLEEINDRLYSFDEIKIINQLAGLYSEGKEKRKAIDIYRQLLKYVRKHLQDVLDTNGMLPMLLYNYARELDIGGYYRDAIEIAEEGRKICLQYGYYQNLPGCLAIMAECYYYLGEIDKSYQMYRWAYSFYTIIEDEKNAEKMKTEAKKYLDENLVF